MKIRKTRLEEIQTVMQLYDHARAFMRSTGNKTQWINGYPSQEIVRQDIQQGNSYVCVDDYEMIVGVFCFSWAIEPNYRIIENGRWLNDSPYGVIHRLASSGRQKGIGDFCLRWCLKQCPNIRVDTHRDNRVMQKILERNGFQVCGVIYVEDGTPRVAFQKDISPSQKQE